MPSFFGGRNKEQKDKGPAVPKVDEALLSRLPVSWPSVDDVARRLTRVYVKYEPDRLAFVDNNAAKFAPQQPAFLVARLSEVLRLPHEVVVDVLAGAPDGSPNEQRSTTPPPPPPLATPPDAAAPAATPQPSDALGRTANHRGNPWMSAEKAHETFRERVERQRREADAAERQKQEEEERALVRATGGFYTADGTVRGDRDCDLCGYHAPAAASGAQPRSRRPRNAPPPRHPEGDRRNLLGDADEARRALVAKAAHPQWGDATAVREDHARQRQRALSTTSSVVPVTFWAKGVGAAAASSRAGSATPQAASNAPTRTGTPAPAPVPPVVVEAPKPDPQEAHAHHNQLPGYRVSGCPFSVPTATSLAARSRGRSTNSHSHHGGGGAADASGLVASRAPSPEDRSDDDDDDDGGGGWVTMQESSGRPLPVGLVIRVLSSADSSPVRRPSGRSGSMLEPAPVHRVPDADHHYTGRSRSESMQRWWSPDLAALEEDEVTARAALYAVCAVKRDALEEQLEDAARRSAEQHHRSPPQLLRSHYHPGGGSPSRHTQHPAAASDAEAFSPVLPVIPTHPGDAATGRGGSGGSFSNTLGSFFSASPSRGQPDEPPLRSGRSGTRKTKTRTHEATKTSRAAHHSQREPASSTGTHAGSFSGTQPGSEPMHPSADTDLEGSRSFGRPPPITTPPPGSFAVASGFGEAIAAYDDDGDGAAAPTSPPYRTAVSEHTLRSHASMLSDVNAHAEGAMFSSEGVKPPPSAVHVDDGDDGGDGHQRSTAAGNGSIATMDESRPLSPRHRKIQRDQLPPELVGAEDTLRKVRLQGVTNSDVGEVTALGDAHWSPLVEKDDAAEHLSAGSAFFSFCCKAGSELSRDVVRHVAAVANLTHFADEEKENGVPRIDMSDHGFIDPLRFIVVKATYALPGVDPSKLTAELLSSVEYHEKCQPGPPKIEKKMQLPPNTIRFVKSIVTFVFSITVQLNVSVITDPAVLDHLVVIDGRRPTHAVLMERTKKDIHKQDSTIKCKSLLLYHAVDGGVVCTNVSVVINRAIPAIVGKIVNSFGSSGTAEVKHTMRHTRKYLLASIGDTRQAAPASTRVKGKGTGAGLFGK